MHQRRQQAPCPTTMRTLQHVDQEHPPQQRSPGVTTLDTTSPRGRPMRHEVTLRRAVAMICFHARGDRGSSGNRAYLIAKLPLRHHPRPYSRRRRQHPVIRQLMPSRPRHQRQQPLDQHLRRQHNVRRAILPGPLQRVGRSAPQTCSSSSRTPAPATEAALSALLPAPARSRRSTAGRRRTSRA